MPCPHGYNVDIPDREIDRMMRANGYGTSTETRTLHELAGSEAGERARQTFALVQEAVAAVRGARDEEP